MPPMRDSRSTELGVLMGELYWHHVRVKVLPPVSAHTSLTWKTGERTVRSLGFKLVVLVCISKEC